DPKWRPGRTDRCSFRLPHYAMRIERGLILVDLSTLTPEPPPPGPIDLGAIPEALAEANVSSRKRYPTTWNWKYLRHLLWASPELAFGGDECSDVAEIGPLSFVALRGDEAALVRLCPRFPGHTDVEIVRLAVRDASRPPAQRASSRQPAAAQTAPRSGPTANAMSRTMAASNGIAKRAASGR